MRWVFPLECAGETHVSDTWKCGSLSFIFSLPIRRRINETNKRNKTHCCATAVFCVQDLS